MRARRECDRQQDGFVPPVRTAELAYAKCSKQYRVWWQLFLFTQLANAEVNYITSTRVSIQLSPSS